MCPENERQSQPPGSSSSARLGVTLTCADLEGSREASKTIWTNTGLNRTPQVEVHWWGTCMRPKKTLWSDSRKMPEKWPTSQTVRYPHTPCSPCKPGDNNKGFGSFMKRLMDAEAAIVSAAAHLVSFKDILKVRFSTRVVLWAEYCKFLMFPLVRRRMLHRLQSTGSAR